MNTTELIIRTNTQTLSNYDSEGMSFRSGVPRISYGSSFKVKWYLYAETPNYNTEGIDFTEWKPDTGYAGCFAKFTCDNDYTKIAYGTLATDYTAGVSISSVPIKFEDDLAHLYLMPEGVLVLHAQNTGNAEYIAYNSYSADQTSGTVTFALIEDYTLKESYSTGSKCGASQEPLFSANHNTTESNPTKGLFVFDVTASSRKFRDLMEGISHLDQVIGFELLPYIVKDAETGETEERPAFLLDTVTLVNSIGHTGFQAVVPETVKDTMVISVANVLSGGFDVEFTNIDTATSGHSTQLATDLFYRFRSKTAGGDWSPWIKLPVGAKGDKGETGEKGRDGVDGINGTNGVSVSNIEQTTTSTVSSGTNVITVTLSDGTQKSFNVWNGAKGEQGIQGVKGDTGEAFHFDAIGTLSEKDQYNDEPMGFAYLDTENGNIYIKNSDTSADWTDPIPFRGEQGVSITKVEQTTTSTASEGTNVVTVTLSDGQTFTFNVKNGAAGKTGDKGDQGDQGVQGPAGVNGLTPHIGENKNWWIGATDTGVLAEGSNLFTNGVPPYTFTNSDLSSGILTRTFAELGIDSAVPVSVNIISGDGVIMDGDVRLAMIWTSAGLKVDLSQLGTISGTWKLVFAGGSKITGGGGSGSGNGYTRTIVSSDSTVQTGYWYTCTSAITLTLPAGSVGAYVRISTDYNTTGVIVATTNGETIDGDAEGFTLDKTSGTIEVFWNGTGWTVIEAK